MGNILTEIEHKICQAHTDKKITYNRALQYKRFIITEGDKNNKRTRTWISQKNPSAFTFVMPALLATREAKSRKYLFT